MADFLTLADRANTAADNLDSSATVGARAHNCRIYSRGFELLSLDSDGERDENLIDYLDRDEMTADALERAADSARADGAAYLAIGYGVDIATDDRAYDDGDYEPMFDWVDLPDIKL